MIYLLEFDAYDPSTNTVKTLRFATQGFTTGPNDTPANIHFEGRTITPGDLRRAIFEPGRTSGSASVAYGYIELALTDADPRQALDFMAAYAVDGRRLVLWQVDGKDSPWTSRKLAFVGTMEQIEYSWTKATIRIRDRLTEIKRNIQSSLYAGTTITGGMNEAEGTPDDLKDRPKPLLFGVGRNIPAVLANRFDTIYQVSANALSGIQAVRDGGVALPQSSNHTSIAALRTASIPAGQRATALSLGLVRPVSEVQRDLTVDATEGASGHRSAGRVARRMLAYAGLVDGVDFVGTDFEALHGVNPAEVGIWIGAEQRDLLQATVAVLDSIGAYISPDEQGRLRVGRIDAPVAGDWPVLDRSIVLGGEVIERLVTSDEGRGVPAWKVTVNYGLSYLVQPSSQIDTVNTSQAIKSFVSQASRSAVAQNEAIRQQHLLAPEITFDTLLVAEADALAEAQRRLALYGVRRDRYRIRFKSEMVEGINLGATVTLKLPRFDLHAGKPFLVIGRDDQFGPGITTLELFG